MSMNLCCYPTSPGVVFDLRIPLPKYRFLLRPSYFWYDSEKEGNRLENIIEGNRFGLVSVRSFLRPVFLIGELSILVRGPDLLSIPYDPSTHCTFTGRVVLFTFLGGNRNWGF